jgi:hypothetical protein
MATARDFERLNPVDSGGLPHTQPLRGAAAIPFRCEREEIPRRPH